MNAQRPLSKRALASVALACSVVGAACRPEGLPKKGVVNTVPEANPGFYAVVLERDVDLRTVLPELERQHQLTVTHRSEWEPVKGFLARTSRAAAEKLAVNALVASVTEIPRLGARRKGRFRRSPQPQLGLYAAKISPTAIDFSMPDVPTWHEDWYAAKEETRRRLRRPAERLAAIHGGKVKEVWPTYKVLFHATELEARRWSEARRVEYVEEISSAAPLDLPPGRKVRAAPAPNPGVYAVVIHDHDVDFTETVSGLARDYPMTVTVCRQDRSPVRGLVARMEPSTAEAVASDSRVEMVTETPTRYDETARFRKSSFPRVGRYTAKLSAAAIGWRPFPGPAWMNPNRQEQDAREQRIAEVMAYALVDAHGGMVERYGDLFVSFAAPEVEALRISNDPRVEFVFEDGYVWIPEHGPCAADKEFSARNGTR